MAHDYLHAYLEKHGPGFHHTTLLFDDIEEVIPELEERGFETTGTNLEAPMWRETFIRPSKAFGTLLQLADSTHDWMEPGWPLEDVLAGKVVWNGQEREYHGEGD